MKAYREGILPSPDGTTLAKVAWKHVALTGVDGAFVPARATAVQIMVTDSKKYAATSGWGGARFVGASQWTRHGSKHAFPATRLK